MARWTGRTVPVPKTVLHELKKATTRSPDHHFQLAAEAGTRDGQVSAFSFERRGARSRICRVKVGDCLLKEFGGGLLVEGIGEPDVDSDHAMVRNTCARARNTPRPPTTASSRPG